MLNKKNAKKEILRIFRPVYIANRCGYGGTLYLLYSKGHWGHEGDNLGTSGDILGTLRDIFVKTGRENFQKIFVVTIDITTTPCYDPFVR